MHQFRTLTSRPSRRSALTIALCSLAMVALLASPAVFSAETCPNAQFRTGPSAALPDCRAYEMVTPPYKEGYKVFPEATSSDGESVLGESIGNFAGVGDSLFSATSGNLYTVGAEYVSTRGESGWASSAIELPASRYPLSAFAASSADLSESLWFAATPSQVALAPNSEFTLGSFVLRRRDGSLAEVGPLYPPSVAPTSVGIRGPAEGQDDWEYADASSENLSHVLFTANHFHWPGDATPSGASSLYEYAGTGNTEPLFVGVNGGPGSMELISRCGTDLGYLDREYRNTSGQYEILDNRKNAVSANGSRVFFTAKACGSSPPVDELFARIDNGLAGAHTVAISEPTKEDCEQCDTEPGVLSGAIFLAASEDGSKVFFSTSQPLLGGDTSNNIYEYDFDAPAGRRIVRVSGGDSTVSNPAADVIPRQEVGAGTGLQKNQISGCRECLQ